MDFYVECLGASREVGRSAFLLHTDKNIINDYGIKIFDESGVPKFPLKTKSPIDFAVISHGHLDHIGCLPSLYKHSKMRWYATPPTKDICEVLWQDSMRIMDDGLPYDISDFHRALKYWTPIVSEGGISTGETTIKITDAGHIAGSAMVEYQYKERSFVYTGDFNCTESQMHKPAKYIKDVDYLMIESTYAKKDHPDRKETEHKFMDEVEMTVEEGGNVLLPSFALGRAQELISIIRKYNREIPVWLDGMGRDISEIYLKYHKYIKDPQTFRKVVKSVNFVRSIEDRKRAIREPSVIVSTAGMMNGGPIINYLLNANSKSKIIFTGFCVEGTNGWLLQNKGTIMKDEQELKVDLPVLYFDFSAHAGRSDILNMIKHANPEKIMLVHGDKPQDFAKELVEDFGYDAIAPLPGERVIMEL